MSERRDINVFLPNNESDNLPRNLTCLHIFENPFTFVEATSSSSTISLTDGKTLSRNGSPTVVWIAIDFVGFSEFAVVLYRGEMSSETVVGVSKNNRLNYYYTSKVYNFNATFKSDFFAL